MTSNQPSPSKENVHLLSVPELLSAKEKLSEIASFYDPGRYTFGGFQSKNLEPFEFRQQISRIFQIELTDKELGCIAAYFDDGTGRIPLYSFMHEFFQMGKQRKERRQIQSRQRRELQEAIVKKQREDFLATILPRDSMRLPTSWTEQEEMGALQKYNKIAIEYTGHHYLIQVFYQFESLGPFEFMMQIWHNFQVELSPEEVAVLTSRLKGDLIDRIDCTRFLFEFFRMRSEHLSRNYEYESYRKERRADREAAFVENFVDRFTFTSPVKMWAATKDDMHSAFVKLKNAASYTKPDIFGNLRKAFDISNLDPTEFHKFLDRYFDVNLSPGELDATMRVFDLDGDGAISYGEFMTTFYQLGLEERSRRLLTQRTRATQEAQARKEKTKKHIETFEQELRSHIVWPILPEEDEMMEDVPPEDSSPNDRGITSTLPNLSPKIGSSKSPLRTSSSKSIITQFPAISPATKDFLRELEAEEKKIRRRRMKKRKPAKVQEVDEYRYEDSDDRVADGSDIGRGMTGDDGGGALENWDFDPSSRVAGEMEQESASFVLGIDDDESSANVAEVDGSGGDSSRHGSRPDSRQVSLSRGSNRPDSRAQFGRPDSRVNSRGALRQNSFESRGPSSPPVNPSGLSGFRTVDGVGEEEDEYGQEEFSVEQF